MKHPIKLRALLLVSMAVFIALLLLPGCGSDVADSLGCPSGSYLMNADDVINIPDDLTITVDSPSNGLPAPATTWRYLLTFSVFDAKSKPRNNVCVRLYTGSTSGAGEAWYTDDTFGTTITGSGPMNGITVVTDDTGQAFLYWSTTTPAALFAVGTTDGADLEGSSWIMFNSGVHSQTMTVDWTVTGEPAP